MKPAQKIPKHPLSPIRSDDLDSSDRDALITEQLNYFGIKKGTEVYYRLTPFLNNIYASEHDIEYIWEFARDFLVHCDQKDKISFFNAKKFICFQLAKLLDNLQNPLRKAYRELGHSDATKLAKGPYSLIDNIPAIFSSQPVITKTATYIYSCIDWIRDAFQGKEFLHSIYSRLLNPTSITLANYIVELECGEEADKYMALNFNSGMSAIDATLSHLLGYEDVLIINENIYGGSHQLIYDWFGKNSNLDIAIESFTGLGVREFTACLKKTKTKHRNLLKQGRRIYVFLESPCNPHGHVLDVPGICKAAHADDLLVILDSTIATPFLIQPLRQKLEARRPDFLIHSYTKDLNGHGTAIGGCVIGKNERIFFPKGETTRIKKSKGKGWNEINWDETMFWNVYYIKGAFLDSEKSYDIIQGIKTLEHRMLAKCINTLVLYKYLGSNPRVKVKSSCSQTKILAAITHLSLPAPLLTLNISMNNLRLFKSFVDSLSPMFGGMVSLGQTDTIISCPALTTHSELNPKDLEKAGIGPSTIRVAVGMEDVMDLILHFKHCTELFIDEEIKGFSSQFMPIGEIARYRKKIYLEVHKKYITSRDYPD